jgi:hypothetical protein
MAQVGMVQELASVKSGAIIAAALAAPVTEQATIPIGLKKVADIVMVPSNTALTGPMSPITAKTVVATNSKPVPIPIVAAPFVTKFFGTTSPTIAGIAKVGTRKPAKTHIAAEKWRSTAGGITHLNTAKPAKDGMKKTAKRAAVTKYARIVSGRTLHVGAKTVSRKELEDSPSTQKQTETQVDQKYTHKSTQKMWIPTIIDTTTPKINGPEKESEKEAMNYIKQTHQPTLLYIP